MIAYRNIFYIIGIFFFIFSILMLFPAIVDFCLSESTAWGFLITAFFGIFFGGLLFFICDEQRRIILNNREKILTVLLFWLIIPIFTALPYFISPFNISFFDSLFETTSALSTASCHTFQNLKSFSVGFALWENFLQIGGGIFFIISCSYVFYELKTLRGELTYDVRIPENSEIIHQVKMILAIYCAIIFTGTLLMINAGTDPVDAFGYSTSAVTTSSITFNNTDSANLQHICWIIILLTFIGGCPVGMFKGFITKGFSALKDRQFSIYFLIVATLGFFLTAYFLKIADGEENFKDIIEKAFLMAVSSITTTGIYWQESALSENFSTSLLYITNFIGGCSGNCTGGVKIFRLIMIFLILKNYFIKIVHSNTVYVPIYNEQKLDETDGVGLLGYFTCYALLAIIFSLLLSVEMDFGRAFGAAITAMNNNGPFIDLHLATPMELSMLSSWAKIILIGAMISGRIEFMLFFIVSLRIFWRK